MLSDGLAWNTPSRDINNIAISTSELEVSFG